MTVAGDEDNHAQEEQDHGEENDNGEDKIRAAVSCLMRLGIGGHSAVRRHSTPEFKWPMTKIFSFPVERFENCWLQARQPESWRMRRSICSMLRVRSLRCR